MSKELCDNARRLLIVEDERLISDQLKEYFVQLGFEVEIVCDGSAAISAAASGRFGVALVDMKLPSLSGLEVLTQLAKTAPDTAVVMMTGYPSLELVISAMRKGACDFVIKPFSVIELEQIVMKATRTYEAAHDYRMLRQLRDTDMATSNHHRGGETSVPSAPDSVSVQPNDFSEGQVRAPIPK